MKKNSVVFKLFLVTSAFILMIFALVMLAQGLFFDRFYMDSKQRELQRHIMEFSQQYGKIARDGREEASRLLGQFMNTNNASMVILDESFQRLSMEPYYIDVEQKGKTVTIRIPSEGMQATDLPQGLHIGDFLVVDGYFVDEADRIMKPVQIQRERSDVQEGLTRFEGNIRDMLLPEQRSFNPLYQDSLIDDVLKDKILSDAHAAERFNRETSSHFQWRDPWSGVNYAVVMQRLTSDARDGSFLFAMTSLQPVGEAVSMLKKYYLYLAPALLFFIVLLSLIFSRMISRPLIKLSRSAINMAELDFTVRTTIHTKDEFGALAQSLNTLAERLHRTLNELMLANEQLRSDMDEKQRLENLRKELIANLSHELKTPLGIVKGFAEGLQDDVAVEKRERYLGFILQEADRMNALIIDMLELSKFEARVIQIHLVAFPIMDVVQRVVDTFTQQLDRKKLQMVMIDETDAPCNVSADPRKIEQVLLNLLSNAIRHAKEQSEIRVRMYRLHPRQLIIRIDNVGSPIAVEDITRIWEPFYRAERSRDRKSGGTGLGLAIVQHILNLHQSEYGVQNTEQGVSFYFTLQEIDRNEMDEHEDYI
ncbi:two-component sensor histidine kinase [Paenibacillus selenitireducens]|uniref:histidine kinase n=1 Tax=Paenibacillus selenitireducens TaxID=1324314 RepID=A0A1T2X5X9_9BACL|nr:HAMP domain-containing sensor histidine kinase [Paenibacillus selenitireducens]OPA75277.1 two-component sensor histidine kinase [Paenibacillus selenitireducens]